MDRNLYAPPSAPVADPVETTGERPWQVAWGVWLLWVSLAIGVIAPILQYTSVFTFFDVLSGMILNGFRYLIAAWLNIKIGQGRHWARILLLLWVLAALAYMAYRWRFYLVGFSGAGGWLLWPLSSARRLLDCVALVLLFTPAANRWFARLKP